MKCRIPLPRTNSQSWLSFLLMCGFLCLLVQPLEAAKKGEIAPDFTLKNLEGREISLSDYRGKFILINFWATWCVPCKVEMPSLEKLYQRFKSNDFELLPISNDMFGVKVVQPYVETQKFSFPVLVDPLLQVSNRYGVVTLPTTFLIDPKGQVIGVREGADDWAKPSNLRFFEELLQKQRSPSKMSSSNLKVSLDTHAP